MALKVGLVGMGGIGNTHANCHRSDELAQLVAVCDVVKEKADAAAERHGVKAYHCLADMLANEEMDIVDVTTGGYENGSWHFEPTMEALAAGKHVLCEMPLSNDIDEAREMVDYAASEGLYLGCNLNHYFTETAARAKQYMEDGDIGDKHFLAGALVRRDSDGDGVPNGREIEQLSFPGSAASSTPPTTTTTIPGAPIDGQALFASRCATCHGSSGGNLSGTALGRSSFISITRNGRGTMPAQSGLTNAEAGAIWDYVTGATPGTTTTTSTTTTIPGATTTTTTPASGAAIWADNCAACHGPNGGNITPTTLSKAQLTGIITNGIGSMRGFSELGTAQISRVADYLLAQGTPATTTTIPGATA
ncbi:MAG: c-type cytochrome, partial [Armatimonadetes bacterium]|nr:c-type cytochrome [Armatimonadota bacterium]